MPRLGVVDGKLRVGGLENRLTVDPRSVEDKVGVRQLVTTRLKRDARIVIQPDEASDLTTLLETLRGVDLHVERIAADRLLVLVPGDGDESGVRTRIEQVLRSAGHNPLWVGD